MPLVNLLERTQIVVAVEWNQVRPFYHRNDKIIAASNDLDQTNLLRPMTL